MTPADSIDCKVGRNLVAALAQQDWPLLESYLQPDISFRALTPPGLREAKDAKGAAAYFRQWFGDAKPLELQSVEAGVLRDRLHLVYRFRAREDRWYVVEQQLYCVLTQGKISHLDLLCSGFRPE
jgi:hypothetical protein